MASNRRMASISHVGRPACKPAVSRVPQSRPALLSRDIEDTTDGREALWQRDEEGQGLAEYALILALIAIIAIAALLFLGGRGVPVHPVEHRRSHLGRVLQAPRAEAGSREAPRFLLSATRRRELAARSGVGAGRPRVRPVLPWRPGPEERVVMPSEPLHHEVEKIDPAIRAVEVEDHGEHRGRGGRPGTAQEERRGAGGALSTSSIRPTSSSSTSGWSCGRARSVAMPTTRRSSCAPSTRRASPSTG